VTEPPGRAATVWPTR